MTTTHYVTLEICCEGDDEAEVKEQLEQTLRELRKMDGVTVCKMEEAKG